MGREGDAGPGDGEVENGKEKGKRESGGAPVGRREESWEKRREEKKDKRAYVVLMRKGR